jgi:FKBP-type peptidyl-prolyl cis-trans isomerase
VIPADQAYGKKGRGDVVPPNSNLIYEMEVAGHIEGTKTKSGVELFPLFAKQGGAQPVDGDKIELGYMGWVKSSGKMFEASAANGKPAEFVLGKPGAIAAWQEAVMQMHEGDKVLAIAPSATCYGSKGVPELVPSNADLVYILELRSVEKAK